MSSGELFIVPTPIGNLDDVSKRVIDTLSKVEIIACEDTRVTGKLLKLLEIGDKRLLSYHNFNEKNSAQGIIKLLLEGRDLALVSDAGYPGISDPGYRLINEAIKNEIKISPLPGPSSIIPALVASGFEIHAFTYLGFPPQKKGRKTFLENAMNQNLTVILLESSHRIIKLMDQINEYDPNRNICVAKEISKIHESFIRGNALSCKEYLESNNAVKGEFVVIIEKGIE